VCGVSRLCCARPPNGASPSGEPPPLEPHCSFGGRFSRRFSLTPPAVRSRSAIGSRPALHIRRLTLARRLPPRTGDSWVGAKRRGPMEIPAGGVALTCPREGKNLSVLALTSSESSSSANERIGRVGLGWAHGRSKPSRRLCDGAQAGRGPRTHRSAPPACAHPTGTSPRDSIQRAYRSRARSSAVKCVPSGWEGRSPSASRLHSAPQKEKRREILAAPLSSERK
jgi:hypothetical protein